MSEKCRRCKTMLKPDEILRGLCWPCHMEVELSDDKPSGQVREFWLDHDPHEENDTYFGEALKRHPQQGPLQWQAITNATHAPTHDILRAIESGTKEAFLERR